MHGEESSISPFLGEQATFDEARVVILPVPYEGTVSYGPGASDGPAAILAASTQVEFYDEQLRLWPFPDAIHTDSPLSCDGVPACEVARRVAGRVGTLMDAGKWVLALGGEHSITPGAVSAAAKRHPGLRVVQLDAHADLRDSYEGDSNSHACAMARSLEFAPVHAFGIRSYSREEATRLDEGIEGHSLLHAWEMNDDGWIVPALEAVGSGPVYLTVDVDYFDPALIPGTGTPEPGGGAWWPTMRFLDGLFDRGPVVAADIVELAPVDGLHHPDFTVARLAHKLLGFLHRSTR